jgi:hypothetical protein
MIVSLDYLLRKYNENKSRIKKIHVSNSVLLVKTIIAEAINVYQRRAS